MTPEHSSNFSVRIPDAVSDSWVYRFLPDSFIPYAQLARWDRPIGWWLLVLPCLWSFALAAPSLLPDYLTIFLVILAFFVGAISMRGAGCTYNDLADQNLDANVSRTASRPLPSGRVTRRSAWIFLVTNSLVGLCALIFLVTFMGHLNLFALTIGLFSLPFVAFYPYAKRLTWWPQFFLGLAFSWGALMGWSVVHSTLPLGIFLLYFGCVCWTIGYDTIYAHQDTADDSPTGIKSTALLFGDRTHLALILFYGLTILLFGLCFWLLAQGIFSYLGLFFCLAHFGWQILSLDIRDSSVCLGIFCSNRLLGLILFISLSIDIFV